MQPKVIMICCFAGLAVSQSLPPREFHFRLIARTNSREPSPSRSPAYSAGELLKETAQRAVDSRGRSPSPNRSPRQILAAGPSRGATSPGVFDRSRPGSPSSISAISGHPNSAMVVATGPGAIQLQQAGEAPITEEVPKGKVKMLNASNDNGVFASALIGGGGRATTASTGNAVTGYIGAGEKGSGYVETHYANVHKTEKGLASQKRRMLAGPSTDGVPRAAALSHIENSGHVTSVGSVEPLPQDDTAPLNGAIQFRKLGRDRKPGVDTRGKKPI